MDGGKAGVFPPGCPSSPGWLSWLTGFESIRVNLRNLSDRPGSLGRGEVGKPGDSRSVVWDRMLIPPGATAGATVFSPHPADFGAGVWPTGRRMGLPRREKFRYFGELMNRSTTLTRFLLGASASALWLATPSFAQSIPGVAALKQAAEKQGRLALGDFEAFRNTYLAEVTIQTPAFTAGGSISGTTTFAGREFDAALLAELPASVDPCGERGEFHTFAYDGPMFRHPVRVQSGEIVERDGFVFADLLI